MQQHAAVCLAMAGAIQDREGIVLGSDEESHATVQRHFLSVTLIGFVILSSVTWKLWTPQTVFPQVPFFELLVAAPAWMDWLCFGSCMLCAVSAAIFLLLRGLGGFFRAVGFSFLIALLVSVLLDQHRLQPWAYLAWLLVAGSLLLERRQAMIWFRFLFISIYAFSALSKLDAQFCFTVGSQMVESASKLVFLDGQLPERVLPKIALVLPIGELMIAIGLSLSKLSKMVRYLAVSMHVVLLIVLGFGMQQSYGVLVWNIVMAAQVFVLFGRDNIGIGAEAPRRKRSAKGRNSWRRICVFVFYGLLFIPLGERLGYCDHWMAWALYAPHSSRVQVEVAPNMVDELPPSLLRLANALPSDEYGQVEIPAGVAKDNDGGTRAFKWQPLPLGQWSLETLGAPVYPQSRFQTGVAISIAKELGNPFGVRATIYSSANRFSGARTATPIDGAELLEWQEGTFFFNVLPRATTLQDRAE